MNTECTREWLRELIDAKYPSINDFARHIKTAPRAVWYWINGERIPTPENKQAIIRALGDNARLAFMQEDYPPYPPEASDER